MQNTAHSLHAVLYHRGPPFLCPLWPCTHHPECSLPTARASRRASRPLRSPPCRGPCLLHGHLTVPSSPYVPCHCSPRRRTLTLPSSPHALCCRAPHSHTHHFNVPVATAHATHLATTTTTTATITLQQRDYHDHPHPRP